MAGRLKILGGCWMALLLWVSSLAAASDLRLVEAVQRGDHEAVRSLLTQHADVNARQADGATALAWAGHRDDLETAELLLRAGADVNAANEYGVTPLSLACGNGNAAMVEKLLQAGANPNAPLLQTGETPLMTCARTGSVDAVKLLLARGADGNAKESRRGHTALMWAAAAKQPEAVRALIEHQADVRGRSQSGFTPLLFAAQQGDLDSSRMLLDAGADLHEATPEDGSALVVASASGHEALALFLLDKGADPNVADGNGITPLHFAVQKGLSFLTGVTYLSDYRVRPPNLPQLVKALLAHGANPNARITRGYPPSTRAPEGPPISMAGATPFFLAAASADVPLMRILASGGADLLLATRQGNTPLMAAAGAARASNRRDEEEEGRSALEAVQLAVELGADGNTRNANGETAMHAAAYTGSDAIVRFLADKGAPVDVKNKNGETPWTMASGMCAISNQCGRYSIHQGTADLLLQLGATPVTLSVVK